MTTPARRPRERRRQEILQAALDCFTERGYAATTLDQIRERSGASVGSIYHLFAGKEEIAGAVYLDGMRAYQEGFTERIVGARSPEEVVRSSVAFYLEWVETTHELARFLMTTRQAELVPAVKDELRAMNRSFFGTLRERFEPHVQAGLVRAMPWELFIAVVIGPSHEHARSWLARRSRTSPVEAAPVLAECAWAAVRGDRREKIEPLAKSEGANAKGRPKATR
jgi:AcrR family transcriptional regulator